MLAVRISLVSSVSCITILALISQAGRAWECGCNYIIMADLDDNIESGYHNNNRDLPSSIRNLGSYIQAIHLL